MSRPARVLPVVRWLQVGTVAAGLGMALAAAPAVAWADDDAAASSSDSTGPSSARAGSSAGTHRSTPQRSGRATPDAVRSNRSAGPARVAAAARVPAPSSVVPDNEPVVPDNEPVSVEISTPVDNTPTPTLLASTPQATAKAPAPAVSPSSAPSLGYLRTLTRLNVNDLISGTGPAVAVNPTATVTGLFNQVLRKNPTEAELQRYLNIWTRSGVNGVVAGLYTSTEFRESEVTNYYLELLGRAPTQLELSRGTTQLKLGKSEPQFAASIVGSPNFNAASAYGGPDQWQPGSVTVPNATTVVSLMYRSMLGQTPNPVTAPTYVKQLEAGLPRGWVARDFVRTEAFRRAKVQEVYAAMGQTATPEQIAQLAGSWLRNGGLAGIATTLLASTANVGRIEAGLVKLPNMAAVSQLQSLLLAQYNEEVDGFVNLFNRLLKTDPVTGLPTCEAFCNVPLLDLIRTGGAFRGLDNRSIVVTDFKADVSKLTPSQNEVDIDKSLGYPLTHADQLREYLIGGYISSQKIISANNGTSIVDGHHRWSGLFVINPDTQLSSFDLGYAPTAKEALAETQFGVAAKDTYLPVEVVVGRNLFTINEEDFKKRVIEIIDFGVPSEGLDPEPVAIRATFLELRGLTTDAEITAFLWQNVLRMRAGNQPIPGATGRGYMPQPKPYQPVFDYMEDGNLSYSFPIVAYIG